MFFEVEMRRVVVVDPRELGGAMETKRAMIRRLITDVDVEQCSEEHGYYVTVTTLEDVSEGKVRTGSGAVVFWVSFKCIVLKLLRGEIVEAEVTEVTHHGFMAACGPSRIFVPRRQMDGLDFHPGQSLESNKWIDSKGRQVMPKSLVRLKVIAVRWEPKDRAMMTVGSLNENHLGPIRLDPSAL